MQRTTLAYHIRRLDDVDRRALAADLQTARDEGKGQHSGDSPVSDARNDDLPVDPDQLAEMLVYAVNPPAREQLCEDHLGARPSDLRPSPGRRLRRRAGRVRARVTRVRVATPPPAVLVVLLAVVGAGAITGLLANTTEPTVEGPMKTASPANGTQPGAEVEPATWQMATMYPSPPVGGFAANISQSHVAVVADPADRRDGCDPSELDRGAGLSRDGTPVYYCISGEP